MWWARAHLPTLVRRQGLHRPDVPARRLRRAAPRKVAAGNRCRTGSKMMSGKVTRGRGKKTSRAAGMICRRSGAMKAAPGPRVGRQGLAGAAALALSVRPRVGQTAMIGRGARARGKMAGELEATESLSTISGLDVFSRKHYTSASKRYCARLPAVFFGLRHAWPLRLCYGACCQPGTGGREQVPGREK